ncbi:hypothetical protein ACIBSW_30805 [Actinoplanes sp. NPDC049668]|uniref:hypothetical protein n=1 Tax=unclassified Actinoplanes TaxID=2626549 RepID=UPI0033BA8CC4
MLDTDVRTDPELEPDDDPGRFNRRRVVRVVTILTLGILAVLAVWQDPLYAGFGR